jgi:16S rRNA (uracil1498-N3)-methyltransferase
MALRGGSEGGWLMRRLHLEPAELAGGEGAEVRLVGARARRLREVLRLRAGATLAVFDGAGQEREARVCSMAGSSVTLALGRALEPVPEPPVPVVLVCAFPRASRGDWLVEKATELGVAQIVPVDADRSVMHPGAGRFERWQRIAVEAAEQCGRSIVPLVGGEPPADALPVVGDPEAPLTIREHFAMRERMPRAVALHIGPEGGWTPAEIEAFDERGAVRCSLGPRLMRVETAAIVAAAQLLEVTGGMRSGGAATQTWL